MVTSHTLTGDLSDLVGTDFPRGSVWVTIRTNLGDADVRDSTGKQIRLPRHRFALAADGTFSKSLWSTAALTTPTGYQYQVEVEWPDGPGGTAKKKWLSGWFSHTADQDLSELAYDPLIPPVYYPELLLARDEAVTARDEAETARAGAEAAQAAAEAVGNTNDTIIAGRINDPASATASALSASIETELGDVMRVAYHGADALLARPDTSGPVLWIGTVTPTNSIAGDVELIADPVAAEPDVDWLGAWTAGSLALTNLAPVESWPSLDAAHTFAQATSTKQPTYYAESGGVPAFIRFDGTSDTMPGVAWGSVKSKLTYIIAFRIHTALAVGANSLRITDSADTTNRHSVTIGRVDDADDQTAVTVHGGTGKGVEPVTDGAWHILSWRHTGDSDSVLRLDGVDYSSGGTGTLGSAGMVLGSNLLGTGAFAPVDIAFIRVHDDTVAPVSLGDVAATEAAFADRLGITLGA